MSFIEGLARGKGESFFAAILTFLFIASSLLIANEYCLTFLTFVCFFSVFLIYVICCNKNLKGKSLKFDLEIENAALEEERKGIGQ